MSKFLSFIKNNKYLILLIGASFVYFLIALKINFFRYNNFDLGKFDLGNMTQMVWNASRGNGLYLTDYFGTNLPRWAMSHVDPVLYIFVPLFWVIPHPMTLVVSQLILVIFSSILIFLIAEIHFKSKISALFLGLAYLFNPSVGFLTAWTAFHGVTAVIPFFLAAFYFFEKMYFQNKYTAKKLILFYFLLILTMMGKEQIPLYITMYGVFILFVRNRTENFSDLIKTVETKIGLSLIFIGLLWFYLAFFVVIPNNAHYRIEGYKKFSQSLDLGENVARDVALSNYFLNRYDAFGTTYSDVIKNILLNPELTVRIFFDGDGLFNFRRTFEPLLFFPFITPLALAISAPDFIINYLTSAGGIGTSEIQNHRISMILPILYISTILGIAYLSKKNKKFINILASFILIGSIVTSHVYNNPIYLWAYQAVKRELVDRVFAKTNTDLIGKDLKIGDVVQISELEEKDRECAAKIVKLIPDGVSVSGPDSLGAHLALRETYAIFPALYNEADYVIVDVFARKIFTILDTDVEILKDVVEDLIKNDGYTLKLGCGNYFVFQKKAQQTTTELLPLQERFSYDKKVSYKFFQGVDLIEYSLPSTATRGDAFNVFAGYYRSGDNADRKTSLEQYIMFTSFINKKTGDLYQQANLPSFAIKPLENWEQGRFYLEKLEIVLPEFLESGDYMTFVGMGNKIRTRSIYLGDINVK